MAKPYDRLQKDKVIVRTEWHVFYDHPEAPKRFYAIEYRNERPYTSKIADTISDIHDWALERALSLEKGRPEIFTAPHLAEIDHLVHVLI